MGPFYWLLDAIGVPDWAAQRLWIGLIQLIAGLGALVLFRTLMPPHRAQLVGALAYGLSPFVLGHVTGQSALLLPFSALPWLVWCAVRTLDEGGWRWPATFALIVTTCGSLNGSSVFFVLIGACLWIPYAVWWQREITWRDGWRVLWHMGLLTFFCQLWWIVAYSIGGKYGLPIWRSPRTSSRRRRRHRPPRSCAASDIGSSTDGTRAGRGSTASRRPTRRAVCSSPSLCPARHRALLRRALRWRRGTTSRC
jgi:hypothetical protein